MFKRFSAVFLCLMCFTLTACANSTASTPTDHVTASHYQTTDPPNVEKNEDKIMQDAKATQPNTTQETNSTTQNSKQNQDLDQVQSVIDDLEKTLNDLDDVD